VGKRRQGRPASRLLDFVRGAEPPRPRLATPSLLATPLASRPPLATPPSWPHPLVATPPSWPHPLVATPSSWPHLPRGRAPPAPGPRLPPLPPPVPSQCRAAAAAAAMWAVLPLLCAGAWLLGAPARATVELSVNSLGMSGVGRAWGCWHCGVGRNRVRVPQGPGPGAMRAEMEVWGGRLHDGLGVQGPTCPHGARA
jgi:hypothetical protein